MFPESFAELWIKKLTSKGDVVLDPFCGRGTSPFQAVLLGRDAIACDVNDVAFCVTKAKTNAPEPALVRKRLAELERDFHASDWDEAALALGEFFATAYSPLTLRQILYLRDTLRWRDDDSDTMLASLILGSLHGESHRSSRYLSNRMPRTISTKPAYSVRFWNERGLIAPERETFNLLREIIEFRYASRRPRRKAKVFHCDMRGLPEKVQEPTADLVLTSPPYLDVTSFEEDQWLRLWFLGRSPFPTYKQVSTDDRHGSASMYWKFISDMWITLEKLVKPSGSVVVRLGARECSPEQLVEGLRTSASTCDRPVELASWHQSTILNRQTRVFTPGTSGCKVEVDCHFTMA